RKDEHLLGPSCGWCCLSATFSGIIWTATKATIKTGGTMMNANHAMTFATVSSVSPWRNEAWAREGSARIAKAMNGMKRLARGQRRIAADCTAEYWVFISKADVVRTIAVSSSAEQ